MVTPGMSTEPSTREPGSTVTLSHSTEFCTHPPATIDPAPTIDSCAEPPSTNLAGGRGDIWVRIGQCRL